MHGAFSEALERLLLTRFLTEEKPQISVKLRCLDPAFDVQDEEDERLLQEFHTFYNRYKCYREKVRKGDIGKTAQFWILYLDFMQYQMMAHTAVQENDLRSLMFCWKQFLPLYFSLNKLHYAR